MTSSSSPDSKDLLENYSGKDLSESESVLNQLHKICAQDINVAQKTVRSLPLICKLLTTDIDLKGKRVEYEINTGDVVKCCHENFTN